jgi:hypothetical protein
LKLLRASLAETHLLSGGRPGRSLFRGMFSLNVGDEDGRGTTAVQLPWFVSLSNQGVYEFASLSMRYPFHEERLKLGLSHLVSHVVRILAID